MKAKILFLIAMVACQAPAKLFATVTSCGNPDPNTIGVQTSPPSLSVTLAAGDSSSQGVKVSESLSFGAQSWIAASPPVTWLSVSPKSGSCSSTPPTLGPCDGTTVTLNAAGLVAGTYVAAVKFTASACSKTNNNPYTMTVNLTVTTPSISITADDS